VSVSVPWDWNVAVFCRNERWSIVRCIDSIADATHERRTLITLIVNGSGDDSATLALEAAARRNIPIVVYIIEHGDKSNAINRFLYGLREPAHHYFFIDAYVKIGPNALAAMEACLMTRPDVVAATGVAVNGRTMQQATGPTLTEGHRMHGQLHALRPEFIDRLVARKLRLPIGLYRGDGLIGSMVLHDLDALHNKWVPSRIASDPEATYAIPMLSPFRLRDLQRQFQRNIRQMRGRLENLAIRSIVYVHNYEGLPEYADDMIATFLTEHGRQDINFLDRPFQALALRQIRAARRPDLGQLEPVLMRRLG
jgi:hypothetical protein